MNSEKPMFPDFTDSIKNPSWWERFCLRFVRTQVSYDPSDGSDMSVMVFVKWWRGKMYIVGIDAQPSRPGAA